MHCANILAFFSITVNFNNTGTFLLKYFVYSKDSVKWYYVFLMYSHLSNQYSYCHGGKFEMLITEPNFRGDCACSEGQIWSILSMNVNKLLSYCLFLCICMCIISPNSTEHIWFDLYYEMYRSLSLIPGNITLFVSGGPVGKGLNKQCWIYNFIMYPEKLEG